MSKKSMKDRLEKITKTMAMKIYYSKTKKKKTVTWDKN